MSHSRLNWFAAALVLALTPAAASASPFVPGKQQDHPIALVKGTVHPVDGPVIEGGAVLFDKGRITAVGKDLKLPKGTEVIDVAGKHVYPGLIEPYSNLGLAEIAAVRATRDHAETGDINPNVRALVAVNPDSATIPVTRSNGVLTTLTAPSGGLLSGLAAVIHLDGWTYEDLALKRDAGLIVNWPRSVPVRAWWTKETAKAQIQRRDRDIQAIHDAFDDARVYWRAQQSVGKPGVRPPAFDSRWEAMIPVLEGKTPIIIEADEIGQIQSAVAFAASQHVRLIIHGGYDAEACAELLKKHDVGVILAGVHRLPRRRDDPYNAPFTAPSRLQKAGVRFCISGHERLGNARNLPYHAATAAAYGLSPEEALRSITLSAAEVLGVADRIGSLTPKKDATLFVTDGDILEVASQVEAAYIQGRAVDLSDKQKLLWEKYKEKYRRLEDQTSEKKSR